MSKCKGRVRGGKWKMCESIWERSLGSVNASGGSKRKVVGNVEGGAQGLAAENARAMGTSESPERAFAVPVKKSN